MKKTIGLRDMIPERRRLYWIWAAMVQRCTNPRTPGYSNYGGRGISVCARWRSFEFFERDMGTRPREQILDRRDNDKGYSPDNCHWIDRTGSNSNRRSSIFVEFAGERMTLKEACRRARLPYRPVHKRIAMLGWDAAKALSTPIGKGNSHAATVR